ncbi:MAG: hypothetical protein IT416_03115 [Candidatus Pacebacteria bacterium]|nr:hypothetical protein [Candidatus Paceibacterota bacterium]
MKFNLRLLYLYLFSFVGLLILIIGGIQLVDLTLKTYVFRVNDYGYYYSDTESPAMREQNKKMYEEEQLNQRKRQLSNSLAMIIVGGPVYLYHWKTIKKENKN